ncbi:AraC family transcriptional regulator [Sphingomonas sp. AR_OL41]|uniref:helix-turn-helix domain-containing protein n=1 Tax=Sphingomonas sp. AR_OL41 TaxID=3042729 RepID=UPI0024813390|nr:AraC family transcriptional regulator [Sphingomonas sp. AR_OL41]MDH7971081.1 AraC family transcriptional regulator [Sphingomonas sp. AR_OL41]
MSDVILDRLLTTMDVAVDAFAICEVRRGLRLIGGASAAVEVHYVLTGTLHLTVGDGPEVRCGPGSIIVVPAGLHQVMAADTAPAIDVRAADNCTPTRSGLLLFDAAEGGVGDVRVLCGLIAANISGSFGLLDAVKQPLVEDLSDLAMVRQSYATMLDEIGGEALGARALTGALMKACLVVLLRRHFASEGQGSSVLSSLRDPRLGKAVTSVLDRPAAAHSVASLARVAGMSRSAFAREFSNNLAMSPMAFVARTRLHHAAELLAATRLPVKVIAASVGFASRSHFSRAFSAAYGADPSGYRRVAGAKPNGAGSATGAHVQ